MLGHISDGSRDAVKQRDESHGADEEKEREEYGIPPIPEGDLRPRPMKGAGEPERKNDVCEIEESRQRERDEHREPVAEDPESKRKDHRVSRPSQEVVLREEVFGGAVDQEETWRHKDEDCRKKKEENKKSEKDDGLPQEGDHFRAGAVLSTSRVRHESCDAPDDRPEENPCQVALVGPPETLGLPWHDTNP